MSAFASPIRAHRRLARTGRGRWPRPVVCAAFVSVGMLLLAETAHAETTSVLAIAENLGQVLTNIRTWVMGLLALGATVFLTVGGVRYLAANGDPGEVGKAKEAFKNAGYGFGLAALAPIVVDILKGFVGGL